MSTRGTIAFIATLLLSAVVIQAADPRAITIIIDPRLQANTTDPECEEGDHACLIRRITRRMLSERRNTRLYFERAEVHQDAGNFSSAERDYTHYLRSNPDDADALYGRGLSLSELKRDREAIRDYDQAIKLDPANAAFYLARGYSFDKIGKQKEAIADYSKAIEFDPELSPAYLNRAMVMDDTDPDGAYADYSKVIELDPDYDEEAYIYRAKILTERRDYEKALSDIEEALKRAPESSLAYFTLAFTRWSMGDSKSGIENLSKAIELDPSQANYFESRARVYDRIGETAKAEADRAAAARIKRSR